MLIMTDRLFEPLPMDAFTRSLEPHERELFVHGHWFFFAYESTDADSSAELMNLEVRIYDTWAPGQSRSTGPVRVNVLDLPGAIYDSLDLAVRDDLKLEPDCHIQFIVDDEFIN